MTGITRTLLGYSKSSEYPSGNLGLSTQCMCLYSWIFYDSSLGLMFATIYVVLRNWFKGSDTTSLLYFLQHRIGDTLDSLDNDARPFFVDMCECIGSANCFMRCLYHSALFLTPDEREYLLETGHKAIQCFHKLAARSFNMGYTRWKYMPKFHMLGEILYTLEVERRKNLPSMSPLVYTTQQDEDFVGKVAAMSRAVSIRTVHARTLSRYLIALATRW